MPAGLESPLPPESANGTGLVSSVNSSGPTEPIRPLVAIDPLDGSAWETALQGATNASFFHGQPWARVLHETYGYRPLYWMGGGQPHFAFPWMEVDSWLTGRRGIALPFTDACSTEGVRLDDFAAALRTLSATARQRRWRYWEFRGGTALFDSTSPSTVFYGHRMRLERTEDGMFARFYGSVRTAVRKAEALGAETEISRTPDAMKAFYTMLCETRKRHGMPPQPFSFFSAILRHIIEPGHGFIALARIAGVPAAGAVFFQSGAEAVYKYAASNPATREVQANNLVLWRGIQHCIRQGVMRMDLGRTSRSNPGLRRFKAGWATEERDIGYFRFDCRNQSYATVRDQSSGWHSTVFRHLPNAAARLFGHVMYRHLA